MVSHLLYRRLAGNAAGKHLRRKMLYLQSLLGGRNRRYDDFDSEHQMLGSMRPELLRLHQFSEDSMWTPAFFRAARNSPVLQVLLESIRRPDTLFSRLSADECLRTAQGTAI